MATSGVRDSPTIPRRPETLMIGSDMLKTFPDEVRDYMRPSEAIQRSAAVLCLLFGKAAARTMGGMKNLNDALQQLDLALTIGQDYARSREEYSHLAHRTLLVAICAGGRRTHRRRQMAGTGRRLLDDDPLRHRRPPRPALPDRHQCHQRSHDRRECAGAGGLR